MQIKKKTLSRVEWYSDAQRTYRHIYHKDEYFEGGIGLISFVGLETPVMLDLDELVACSSLPCFVTDYISNLEGSYPGRITIPLTDAEAKVTFYMICDDCKNL